MQYYGNDPPLVNILSQPFLQDLLGTTFLGDAANQYLQDLYTRLGIAIVPALVPGGATNIQAENSPYIWGATQEQMAVQTNPVTLQLLENLVQPQGCPTGLNMVRSDFVGSDLVDFAKEMNQKIADDVPIMSLPTFTVAEGGTVQLGAIVAFKLGDRLTYAWDLDGTGRFATSGETPYFSAGEQGVMPIRVKVTTQCGYSTIAQGTVTVTDAPLTAMGGFTFLATEGRPSASQTVAAFTDAYPKGPSATIAPRSPGETARPRQARSPPTVTAASMSATATSTPRRAATRSR
ncbi:MAG TPA: hypothetical protein VMS64_29675 [Candidatus Methylomirabilis sp.]|nr:hypothetical protein [Candidatus Methylomirabilis sp.]